MLLTALLWHPMHETNSTSVARLDYSTGTTHIPNPLAHDTVIAPSLDHRPQFTILYHSFPHGLLPFHTLSYPLPIRS